MRSCESLAQGKKGMGKRTVKVAGCSWEGKKTKFVDKISAPLEAGSHAVEGCEVSTFQAERMCSEKPRKRRRVVADAFKGVDPALPFLKVAKLLLLGTTKKRMKRAKLEARLVSQLSLQPGIVAQRLNKRLQSGALAMDRKWVKLA
jgi:hypothetical protein